MKEETKDYSMGVTLIPHIFHCKKCGDVVERKLPAKTKKQVVCFACKQKRTSPQDD